MDQGAMSDDEFNRHVRVIDAALSDLPDLADEWPSLGVADRATAIHEWSEAMAHLQRLVDAATRGRLNPDRLTHVSELRRHLAASLTAAEALGLRDPRARTLAAITPAGRR